MARGPRPFLAHVSGRSGESGTAEDARSEALAEQVLRLVKPVLRIAEPIHLKLGKPVLICAGNLEPVVILR